MKIFPSNVISQLDQYTIEQEPILSINLMERASLQLFQWVQSRFSASSALIVAGFGNNGGDALALARMLAFDGWDITVWHYQPLKMSADCSASYNRMKHISQIKVLDIDSIPSLEIPQNVSLIVDGLFGVGLSRPLEGKAIEIVKLINQSKKTIVAIDIPSGLMAEENQFPNDNVINATNTLTFEFPKLSFLFPENERMLGSWEILPIGLHPESKNKIESNWHYVTLETIKPKFPVRDKFTHKGHFGHALLLSGSYGKMGAAVLASKACLKSGVGLLTTHVPHFGYNIIQTAVPEAMVSIDRSDILLTEFPNLSDFDAVGIGPGIGCTANTCQTLQQLLQKCTKPLVIDADGLNILANHKDWLELLPPGTVLTPHPKEFERLVGSWKNDFDRLKIAIEFSHKYQIVLVLKGAHTTIVLPSGECYFNSTGNPGMATAGSGDVLIGVILGFLSQGLSSADSAILGVYLHGLAGDIYAEEESEESLTAGDIILNLGKAIRKIRF